MTVGAVLQLIVTGLPVEQQLELFHDFYAYLAGQELVDADSVHKLLASG